MNVASAAQDNRRNKVTDFHGETLTSYEPQPTMLDTVALRIDQILYVQFHSLGNADVTAYVYWLDRERGRLELNSDDAHQLWLYFEPDAPETPA
jgi:hypothetical protein